MMMTEDRIDAYGRLIFETKENLPYLIEQDPNVQKKDRKKVLTSAQIHFKNKIDFHLRKIANLQCLALEKLNILDDSSFMSYCRDYFKIKTTQWLTSIHIEIMRQHLRDIDLYNGSLSGEEYLKFIKNDYSFDFCGKEFTIQNLTELNEFLYRLDINNLRIFATHDDLCTIRFIFSEAEFKEVNGIYEYHLLRELVRSPQWHLAIVSEIHGMNGTIVRHEACQVIYLNKWKYKPSKQEMAEALRHPYSIIGQGFKNKALFFYNKHTGG